MAVVDAVNATPKHMREAVARGEDYEQFKTESAKHNVRLNEYFHQVNYANVARAKCEPLITESGPGLASNEAFTAPTDQQLDRRVDDSGIGVGSPGTSGQPSGTEQ